MAEARKLTAKQEAFLDHLFGEAQGDIRTAMTLAGYSKDANIHDLVRSLSEEITKLAEMHLSMNAPKAVLGLSGVLSDPAALGARNVVAAAKEILDRAGLVKKEQIEVEHKGGGMFILPPKANSADDVGDEDSA